VNKEKKHNQGENLQDKVPLVQVPRYVDYYQVPEVHLSVDLYISIIQMLIYLNTESSYLSTVLQHWMELL
jgi:hypothetical protein